MAGDGMKWSETEDKILVGMYGDDVEWPAIHKRLPSRTLGAIKSRLHHLNISLAGRRNAIDPAQHIDVADILEADRVARSDARSLRDARDLSRGICTAAFFNDPPPGRSALDRKRAGA